MIAITNKYFKLKLSFLYEEILLWGRYLLEPSKTITKLNAKSIDSWPGSKYKEKKNMLVSNTHNKKTSYTWLQNLKQRFYCVTELKVVIGFTIKIQ